MPIDSVDVQIRAVCAVPESCAVFLGSPEKVFVIHVDPAVGQSITVALSAVKKTRPLTHDLMMNIMVGFGIKLERVVINDAIGETFYARIILRMENELGVKLVEVDARPSDAMVLALNARKPIAAARSLLKKVDDASELLERLMKGKN